MTAVRPYLTEGPESHVANVAITGGQGVMPDTGGTVKPWTATATNPLGVAETDAQPASNTFGSGTTGYGAPFVDTGVPGSLVAVGTSGVYYMTYAAAANFGDTLTVAANGQVTPYTAAPTDARAIVGKCVEPAGVVAGASGRVRLLLG